jgi:hypothetical protein
MYLFNLFRFFPVIFFPGKGLVISVVSLRLVLVPENDTLLRLLVVSLGEFRYLCLADQRAYASFHLGVFSLPPFSSLPCVAKGGKFWFYKFWFCIENDRHFYSTLYVPIRATDMLS